MKGCDIGMDQKYLTTKQLAEKLQVSTETIYRWRKIGMPHARISERTIRYDLDKVLEWRKLNGYHKGNGQAN
jgi:excisionase family DNA binding protein